MILASALLQSCGGGGSSSTQQQPDFAITLSSGSLDVSVGSTSKTVTVSVTGNRGFTGNVDVTVTGLPSGVSVSPPLPLVVAAGASQTFATSASSASQAGDVTLTVTGSAGSLVHSDTLALHVLPAPDFTLTTDTTSVGVTQGAIGGALQVKVGAVGTFSDPVVVSVSGVPAGVATIPAFPITMTPNSQQSLQFQVSPGTAPGSFSLNLSASGGGLSHDAGLTLAITALAGPGFSHLDYLPTDAPPLSAVFDQAHHQIFASISDLNRVDVFSTLLARRIASISVPRPAGIDLTPDGTRVVVGSYAEQLAFIDTTTLKVVQRVSLGRVNTSNGVLTFPTSVVPTSNGSYLLILQNQGNGTSLMQWNPATGSLKERNSETGGAGNLTRSADYSKVLIRSVTSGGYSLYDANTDQITRAAALNGFAGALNADGSEIAFTDTQNLYVVDAGFNLLFTRNLPYSAGVVFSPDGRRLYVSDSTQTNSVIDVYDASTFALLGQCPSGPLDYTNPFREGSAIFGMGEDGVTFGAGEYGLVFSDVSSPKALPSAGPQAYFVLPGQGPIGQQTSVQFSVGQSRAGGNAYFGGVLASSVSEDTLSATAPPLTTAGPVSVLLSYPDGWSAVMPAAFSYGPSISYLDPSGGSAAGGEQIELLGLGIGMDPAKIAVSIGGKAAKVINTDPPTPPVSDFPYPLLRLVVQVPAGNPGFADVTLTTPEGSFTARGAYLYTQSRIVVSLPGQHGQAVIDPLRERVYVSNATSNRVDVVDLSSGQIYAPIATGAAPAGLALTSDASTLVVANYGDGTVSVIDLATGTAAQVPIVDPNDTVGDPRPVLVSTLHDGTAFVAMVRAQSTGCDQSLRQLNLSTHAALTRTDTQIPCGTQSPWLAASTDGKYAVYGSIDDALNPTTVALWSSGSGTFTARSVTGFADLAVSENGTVASGDIALDSSLNWTLLPGSFRWLQSSSPGVPGTKLVSSGALAYTPYGNGPWGQGFYIWDEHTGLVRKQIALPEDYAALQDNLAVSADGQSAVAITTSGLTILHLLAAPLGVGWLEPNVAPAGGGSLITVHGSGFVAGATVSVDGTAVASTVVDADTMTFALPPTKPGAKSVLVTNADGSSYSLDAALTASP